MRLIQRSGVESPPQRADALVTLGIGVWESQIQSAEQCLTAGAPGNMSWAGCASKCALPSGSAKAGGAQDARLAGSEWPKNRLNDMLPIGHRDRDGELAQSDSGLLSDQNGLATVLRNLPQTAQQCNPLRPTNAFRRARQIAEGRNRGGQAPAQKKHPKAPAWILTCSESRQGCKWPLSSSHPPG